MMQREIYLAELDPSVGSEQQGVRPVLIISGNAMNEMTDLCIVCPLTSIIKNYPGSVVLKISKKNGLSEDSEVLVFQIRVISKNRLIRKLGMITEVELSRIKQGLIDIMTF